MKYTSTRDKSVSISASEAIIQGISKEGGLFVPKYFPKIKELVDLIDMNYEEIAVFIMSQFFSDIPLEKIKESVYKAYDDKFKSSLITPLVKVDDVFFLELYHGPTLAFKDIALSILPYLLKESIKINQITKDVVILTATSGDTGKAALEAFAHIDGIKIIVFFPKDGVSQVQKLQMITQEGHNTCVISINGNFDDAQSGVKEIFNDLEFIDELFKNDYVLSSANSINIGRLVPQVVYYFNSYVTLLKNGDINIDEKVNFVVPTGNFGNILAGYYAKEMGLPINKLICASNDNNVLSDFLDTGVYDKNRELILSTSPSMDILISSNLERLLFHKSQGDDKLLADKMNQLSERGVYEIDLSLNDFYGSYASEEEVSLSINSLFQNNDYLVDPHTAVAHRVYTKYKDLTKDKTKTIIVSTASPFKFGPKVASSIGLNVKDKDEFTILKNLSQLSKIDLPAPIKDLENKDIKHFNSCNKQEMKEMVELFLRRD